MEQEQTEKTERSVDYSIKKYNLPEHLREDAIQEVETCKYLQPNEPLSYIIHRFYASYLEIPTFLKNKYKRQISAMIELDLIMNEIQEEEQYEEIQPPSKELTKMFIQEKNLELPPEEDFNHFYSNIFKENINPNTNEHFEILDQESNLLTREEIENNVLDEQIKEALREYIDEVSDVFGEKNERNKTIMILRYGLNGNKAHNFKQISKIVNISYQRVKQIHDQTLRRLKNPSLTKKLEIYDI